MTMRSGASVKLVMLLTVIFVLVAVVSEKVEARDKKKSGSENTFTSPTLGAKFILIPAGTFTMGLPSHEAEAWEEKDNETQHRVTISCPFYMQTTEVTQGQWKKIMGNNPSDFNDCGDDCPVENVSWDDVQIFISKLNSREGTSKYRLPTEAEWEYAARSGGRQEKYAGTDSESILGEYAWYKENSGDKTHPVARKKPNGLGLYDMSGNVWEWVQDWDGSYPSGHVTDPTGPSSGSDRVNRGGSWFDDARAARAAYRIGGPPGDRHLGIGFRLLRTQ